MEQSILDYVREALKCGLDVPTVRQNLLAKAWDPALVDDALRTYGPPEAPVPPTCSFASGLGSTPANASSSTADLLSDTPELDPNVKPSSVWNVEPTKPEDRAEAPKLRTTEEIDVKHWKKYYEFPKRGSGWFLIIATFLLAVGVSVGSVWIQQSGLMVQSGTPPVSLDEAARQQAERARAEAVSRALYVAQALSAFLFLLGLPIGVVKLGRRHLKPGVPYDQRSGPGENSAVPEEIEGWSWGAFGLNLWWGLYHGLWSSLLMIVPGVNLIWIFVMGFTGRQSVWRKLPWLNVEHFERVQKAWNVWGVIVLLSCAGTTAAGLWFGLSQVTRLYGLVTGPAAP